ncbi:leucine-rich repeat and calponin homology domain-containing protein 1-like, partial [Ascaphus truei]|uniref:leucine-rich repeat and calponin homology domain-containing protein 1-like n=1 Tax=Ascaphus truei TaxID=8439 RepID=UPI003F5A25E9
EIESRLNVSLGECPGDALADGVVLCQLVNQLRPRSIPCVHVPSPAVPKLNPVKCRRNVDSFLDACRRIGVPERDLCLPSDILGGEHPLIVLRTVSSLLLLPPEAAASPHPPPSPLPHGAARCSPRPFILPSSIGFLLFYVLLMLTLYAAYRKVCVL